VSHLYGERTVLDNVSFTVASGEMVAIVGPSGAGKTTLLRLVAGMLGPVVGEIDVYGVRPFEIADAAARTELVGMMQQRLDLVPQLSARHNVDAGMLGRWSLLRSLAGLLLPVAYEPTTSALERVGLAGRESDRVGRLSGGEQQRVALARVLVQDPKLILADEPVSSLDPALADELLSLFRSVVQERGRSVIATLHNPDLARRHFDRVIGLRHGRLVFDVSSADLTAGLLAELYGTALPDSPVVTVDSPGVTRSPGPWVD
jgi:phosphonate transport system ATP-binding protein